MAKRSRGSSDGKPGKASRVAAKQRRPAGPGPARSVRAGELLTLAELKRRLHWGDHAVRQARRVGLRLIAFGSQKYALGSDVLRFFRELADGQGKTGDREGGADGST